MTLRVEGLPVEKRLGLDSVLHVSWAALALWNCMVDLPVNTKLVFA